MEDIEDALQNYTAIKFKLDIFISTDHELKKAAILNCRFIPLQSYSSV